MFTSEDELTGAFTFAAEGSPDPESRYYIGRIHHPSPESGVTIGAGYDMRHRTSEEVANDLVGAGVDDELARRIAAGAGRHGNDASSFVALHAHDLTIDDPNVPRRLFGNIWPTYVSRARSAYRFHASTFAAAMPTYGRKFAKATFFDWEYLYPAVRVIAIDLVYQGFGKAMTGYGRPLHMCMANDFDWLADYIRQTPAIAQYEGGRGRARYLERHKLAQQMMFSTCSGPEQGALGR